MVGRRFLKRLNDFEIARENLTTCIVICKLIDDNFEEHRHVRNMKHSLEDRIAIPTATTAFDEVRGFVVSVQIIYFIKLMFFILCIVYWPIESIIKNLSRE